MRFIIIGNHCIIYCIKRDSKRGNIITSMPCVRTRIYSHYRYSLLPSTRRLTIKLCYFSRYVNPSRPGRRVVNYSFCMLCGNTTTATTAAISTHLITTNHKRINVLPLLPLLPLLLLLLLLVTSTQLPTQ